MELDEFCPFNKALPALELQFSYDSPMIYNSKINCVKLVGRSLTFRNKYWDSGMSTS